jgi:hypothetical protein
LNAAKQEVQEETVLRREQPRPKPEKVVEEEKEKVEGTGEDVLHSAPLELDSTMSKKRTTLKRMAHNLKIA